MDTSPPNPMAAAAQAWPNIPNAQAKLVGKMEKEVMEWQSIESAPKDGTPVLIYSGSQNVELAWYDEEADQFPWRIIDDFNIVTIDGVADWEETDLVPVNGAMSSYPLRWMPLPEPPKEDQ